MEGEHLCRPDLFIVLTVPLVGLFHYFLVDSLQVLIILGVTLMKQMMSGLINGKVCVSVFCAVLHSF